MEGLLASDLADTAHYSLCSLGPSKPPVSGEAPDDDIFARYGPLRRLLYLSLGPLISQIALSLSGFADTFWVAKACGDDGLAVFGAVFIVDFIAVAIGQYLITGISARASYLSGHQETAECERLFVDFIRIAFIAGLAVPALVLPITRPLVEWFGGDPAFSRRCLEFMVPPTCGCFATFVYMICCGQAQAEGRSLTFAVLQIGALAAAHCLFNPLFLILLKTPIWGSSLARVCGEALAALAGVCLIFRGKFKIRPTARMFLGSFSRETWAGMKIGFAEFISVCSETLPMVLVQKYVNSASKAIGVYEIVLEVWALIEKVYQFVVGICVAFALGMLPSAAHAYGARHYKDCLATSLHTLWFTTVISVVLSAPFAIWPTTVCRLWSHEPQFIEWVGKMMPQTLYAAPSFAMLFMVPVLYEAMQRYAASSILAFVTQFLPLPIFASVLHFTKTNDPARVLWAYCLTDGFAFIVCAAFYIGPLVKFMRTPATIEEIAARPRRQKSKSDPGVTTYT
jgi:Na+-driven multidrug efflux pump